MNTYDWYQTLLKPQWAPPAMLFGPVWTFLYILIAISFGTIIYKWLKKELPFKIALPFILNLLFNFIFTPIQFGLQNNLLATIDILLLVATLIWAMIVIYPKAQWIALIQIPYLLWGTFATILQIAITVLNQ